MNISEYYLYDKNISRLYSLNTFLLNSYKNSKINYEKRRLSSSMWCLRKYIDNLILTTDKGTIEDADLDFLKHCKEYLDLGDSNNYISFIFWAECNSEKFGYKGEVDANQTIDCKHLIYQCALEYNKYNINKRYSYIFCPICGKTNTIHDKFCSECDSPLIDEEYVDEIENDYDFTHEDRFYERQFLQDQIKIENELNAFDDEGELVVNKLNTNTVSINDDFIICPKCKNQISSNKNYCSYCGTKITKKSKRFCSNCGTLLDADDIFCINCGKKIED